MAWSADLYARHTHTYTHHSIAAPPTTLACAQQYEERPKARKHAGGSHCTDAMVFAIVPAEIGHLGGNHSRRLSKVNDKLQNKSQCKGLRGYFRGSLVVCLCRVHLFTISSRESETVRFPTLTNVRGNRHTVDHLTPVSASRFNSDNFLDKRSHIHSTISVCGLYYTCMRTQLYLCAHPTITA